MEDRPTLDLLSGRTLFRSGLALVILSVSFLFRFSVEQGWLGPLERVGLAAAAGALMIGIGLTMGQPRRLYSNLLQGGGSAVLYMTAFAAHSRYELITQSDALIQLAAISVVSVVLALRSRSESLASIGLFGASAAPLLIGGRLTVPGGDTMYLAAVAVAATILLVRMHWLLSYVVAAASISFAVGLGVVASRVAELGPAPSVAESVGSVSLAWLMLVVIPAALTFGRVGNPKIHTALPVVTTSFGSPLTYAALYGGSTLDLDRFDWALVAGAAALFHAGLSLGLRNQGRSIVARIQLIPTTILALLSLFAGLSGNWLLVGMIAISTAAVVGGGRSGVANLKDFGHVGMAITVIATAITSGLAAFEPRTITQLIPGAAVLGFIAATGLYLREDDTENDEMDKVYLTTAFIGAAGWMFVEFPRLGTSGLAAVTAGLATLGLGAIFVGKVTTSRLTLGLGFSTVGVAMAKLFLVDLAEATPLVRIALFGGIGVALLGSGYWLGDSPPAGDGGSSTPDEVADRFDAGTTDHGDTDTEATGAEFPITDIVR